MKAFLLAAGLGTRLKPITDTVPKCLVPVAGKPMLAYWFDLFRKHGITEVLINLNHLPDHVRQFVKENDQDIKVTLVYEETLLGSLGTILQNKYYIENEECFFIFYADTLTNVDLADMLRTHKSSGKPFTMGLFHADNPSSCGIAELDENNIIIGFEEKPQEPKSALANAGLYIMDTLLLNEIKSSQDKLLDIGYDLLPTLVSNMTGYKHINFVLDIGTPDNLIRASEFVKNNPRIFL
ncbi:nucleotidyltransferase family protein [Sediminibacterium sp. TEGAF015]|uniref:nucleotidyltransferase family protein n=1 Tax=Sediminibacterium sp. TEGAF015 TaxID=575378 RepID=UPI002203B1CA|nr:nucleotidyltransferase family protein [Sediminibacterium sp. TEGAF015]BDQ13336.1 mannose-1-phosphate guanylyltransferase [Sediminibacterium sp. TEGAF015]